jgi:ankyrin repeat protein
VKNISGENKERAISAAAVGDVAMLKELLVAGGLTSAINETDDNSVLSAAAFFGQTHAVRFLLKAGFCVNALDDKGMTPLMNAVLNGKVETVKLLLDEGADPEVAAKRADGKRTSLTAGSIARLRGDVFVLNLFDKYQSNTK